MSTNLGLSPSISKVGKWNENRFKFLFSDRQDYIKPPTPRLYKEYSSSLKEEIKMKGMQKMMKIEPLVKFNFLD